MKVFDSITIGCSGYPSSAMTLSELIAFADNVRGHEGILIEASNDHRTVVYNFIKSEDLSSHSNLKIDNDAPWLLAEKNKTYKRKDDESVDAWKERIFDVIRKQGYIVRNDKPVLVGTLILDPTISGFFKVTGTSLKIDGDATVYTVYPCKTEAHY